MSTVFKLVLPGKRIQSARPRDLAVSNLYPNPKVALNQTPTHVGIIKVDVITGPIYSNGTITTWYSFGHGYDYVPAVVGIFSQGGGADGGILPYSGFGALGEMFLDADKKNVNLKFESFDSVGIALPERHVLVRYYIFAEQGLDT